MPIKVLVVDDEKDIVELVCYHLERAGVRCLQAADGSTALRLIREQHPDLLILDLMLPGLDGLEICRQLRRDPATMRLPTIMLTARAEEVDRVVGLEVGADDYVVKPFSPRELVARVKAILRRAQEPTGASVRRIGELEVDEARHQVRVKDALVGLTAKEFGLLCALIRANGRVLNREQLLEGVWGYVEAAEIESRTVDVHIRRLREKLGTRVTVIADDGTVLGDSERDLAGVRGMENHTD
ncbi:MAG: response regulator [Nitrospinae bacterium]|nr:response regulator [Nitrospinota bacterium]